MNPTETGQPDPKHSPVQPAGSSSLRDPSRRRWLRSGLKASPAVLALSSQPVLAWKCKTPSAHASANLSRGTYQEVDYYKSPGTCADWKRKCDAPTTTCYPTGGGGELLFPYPYTHNSSCSSLMGSGRTDSIKYVLTYGTSWEKACVTAVLNAKCGRVETYCADEADFKAMWQQGDAYSPSSGKTWTKVDVVNYLSATGFARP